MAEKFYIIDGHSHIYAAFFAPMQQELTSPSGEPTKASYIFTNMLMGLIQRHKPDMLAVAMDSKERTFRKDIYEAYKAHREAMPEELPAQIKQIERILQAMNIPMLRVDGFEADDIIGTLAEKTSQQGCQVYICSNDKDILQLVNQNIRVYDIRKDKVIDAAKMEAKIGVRPEQFVDCLALEGDASDNIPGVPDVGPKTGRQWIREYGSLDNLLAHADEIKGKRGKSLRTNKENALLSKELLLIRKDVPVDADCKLFVRKDFDQEKLKAVFAELGFNKLLRQLQTSRENSNIPENTALSVESAEPEYNLIDTPEKFDQFVSELKNRKTFAMNVQAKSALPMRAELIGMGFSWEPGQAYYLPVKASLGAASLDIRLLREKLDPILCDTGYSKICHDVKYNALTLENAGLCIDGVSFDTMIASYCLDAERSDHSLSRLANDFLGHRCMELVELTGKGKNKLSFDMVDTDAACRYGGESADIIYRLGGHLHKRLETEPDIRRLFEQVEMPLANVLAAMERNGVSIDVRLLREMSLELSAQLEQLTEKIYALAGTVFNIDSPKQLGEVLFDRLGLTSGRMGKTGRSTDVTVLESLAQEHEIIDLTLQYRQLSKLKNTYVDKLGSLINPRTNRLHCSFNQTVTATGRLSSSSPNLQNIPIRTDIGRKIRAAFVPAQKQSCIVSADYSQVELRLLAHFSGDETLKDAFARDMDIHSFVASEIYNVPLEDVTGQMRSKCKAVNFGIIYGQSAHGLSNSIGISRSEAKEFIDAYFARYGSIRKFMDDIIAKASANGYVETILHRRRRIANLNSSNNARRLQAQRLAVNTVIQGSAADLIKVAMINIHRKIEQQHPAVKMLLQVHDELVFEMPADQAEQHIKWIRDEMATALSLDIPVRVDIHCGSSWLVDK